MSKAHTEIQSVSAIKFGPGNVLFVGDSRTATIFAFELGEVTPAEGGEPFNIRGVDQKIADVLGAPLDQIAVKDMAVQPITQEAYIAVQRGHGDKARPVIVRVRADGGVHPLELSAIPCTTVTLENPADAELRLWNGVMARTLAITDIEIVGGELFVAGLSNGDFASSLYRISYPFKAAVTTSRIEMFHAVHNQNETRAPIQTMTILELGGKPHVLAAYVCTPLVTIPVEMLADGAHVKGKTIAELGYGNAPIDIIHFEARDMAGQAKDQILITNRVRGAMLFDVKAIAERNEKEGMTTGVGMTVVAPEHAEVPLAGLIHVGEQNDQFLLALRRDIETGRLDLLSFRKGLYFRLSDFVSEYMLPGYPQLAPQMEAFHGMMKKDEGFA
jgi:hypothetical protein